MNWFDGSGFANIAKNALKEAQRTIDKALDIKEESNSEPQVPIDTNADPCFEDWPQHIPTNEEQVVTSSPTKINSKSIWGSFTGSFFETELTMQHTSTEALYESADFQMERSNQSKLVLQNSENNELGVGAAISANETSKVANVLFEQIDNVAITRPPSKTHGCQLNDKDLQINSNVIDIPHDLENMDDADDSTYSDKTITALNESAMESSTDTTDSANSVYLKTLLADAIIEKTENAIGEITEDSAESANCDSSFVLTKRDVSPQSSSESHSDVVKIGSDHTSGHTSGDEIETTTSSDIEIISSPNGDSSSTHSRHSPDKRVTDLRPKSHGLLTQKLPKGHSRELSEASSLSDECELERTMKRLSEMTSVLEQKEDRLLEMSRRHLELQETNESLRKQLDLLSSKQVKSMEMSQVAQEYTQRLSALEKKFQQAIRDRDSLKAQLEQCKKESATRLTKNEIDQVIEEKNQLIKELREEGEKLSKTQLQQSNTIKRLRLKEKEQESSMKSLKESVEELTSETDRLKRSLKAKEDIERLQIEAIHQLTDKNKKAEYELTQLQGIYEDMQQKHETIKKSLEAAKKELLEKQRASNELMHREQLLQSLESSKKMTESQNEEIITQLEDLRNKLLQSENEFIIKEQKLRGENAELMRRLENAESRSEELSQSVLEVSKPLVRQLETLQASHNLKVSTFEKIEEEYTLKLNELNNKIRNLMDSEQILKKENFMVKNNLTKLQNDIEYQIQQNEQLKIQLNQLSMEKMILEQNYEISICELKDELAKEQNSESNLQKELKNLEHCLNVERLNHAKELSKCKSEASQENINESSNNNFVRAESPTTSIGHVSASGSLSSTLWPEDNLEVQPYSRCTNILEMELLQSNLKQRDGDMQQLHWELNRREQERLLLNAEITNLLQRIETLEANCTTFEGSAKELGELQQKYEALCQLYGEKVEEADELKLDLVDVKEMYKMQVDDLLRQIQQMKSK